MTKLWISIVIAILAGPLDLRAQEGGRGDGNDPYSGWSSIVEIDGFELTYDTFADGLNERDIRAEIGYFRRIDSLRKKKGDKPQACRVGNVDFPCSRRSEISLHRSSYQLVIDGLLPPPVPWGVLNQRMKDDFEKEYSDAVVTGAEFGADERYDLVSERVLAALDETAFDDSIVEEMFRTQWWYPIEDFSEFAPVDRVSYGEKVFRLIVDLSADRATTCEGLCPLYRGRKVGRYDLYEMCSRRIVSGVSSMLVYCTPVAFVDGEDAWLRTTLIYGLGIDEGRGDGPFEMFRCSTELPMLAAVEALDRFFRTNESAEVATKRGADFANLIAVAWRDRRSVVAKNRWELIYFDFWIRPTESPIGGRVTEVNYRIPVYRISDTRPSSLDDGLRPKDSIVRLFEARSRKLLAQALKPAQCYDVPADVDY